MDSSKMMPESLMDDFNFFKRKSSISLKLRSQKMRFLILSEYFCFNAESLQPDLSGALFVKQKSGSGRHK